jgi:hypothetical protein
MKKLFALLASAALLCAVASPANAEIIDVSDSYAGTFWHGNAKTSGGVSLNISGSPAEGSSYAANATLACPATNSFSYEGVPVTGTLWSQQFNRIYEGNFGDVIAESGAWTISSGPYSAIQVSTGPLTSGAAGTSRTFVASTLCGYTIDGSGGTRYFSWYLRSAYMRIVFESALGTPSNFSVFPQAGGTAYTTWGIANGATSYTVTAAPGGQSCTTTQNSCNVTGLTNGETYTFNLTATNGTATTTVGSGPVLMRQPANVAVALNGGTWRVGETVTAQYSLQGSNATPTISWYRCNSPVVAIPTPPPPGECTVVGSGASYVLASGDVGKFVTANVFVNNTDPQGQMTASSNQAVLASGAVAPAPVADPAGKPTIVNVVNPIVSVAGGTEVTITGTGLSGVTAVTVGGLPAIVVSKTDTTVVVQVPVSTKTGLADLTVTNDKGSVTSKSAIVYTTNPVIKITKTRTITGFTANQRVLTNGQKAAVRTLLTANPTLTELTCAARTTGVKASKTELAKARTLATATCTYAKSLKKTLVIKTSATQTLPKAKASRTVLLTLKN